MIINSSVFECNILEFNQIHNRSGNITFVENRHNIPFEIKRVYYLYDIPAGAQRGGHAHKELYQLIIAAGGCFDIIVDDGRTKKIFELNRPYYGVLIVPGVWREIVNFSSGAICLVLASHKYDEKDYIRDYNEFIKLKNEGVFHI